MAKLESNQIDYSLEEGPEFNSFVKSVISIMKKSRIDRQILSSLANNRYSWSSVAKKWIEHF
jgi:hypothetical protein